MRCRLFFPLAAVAAGLLFAPPATAQNAETVVRGAQVWSQQCIRCHTARTADEYTDRQWATIVLHMRARANLTRNEARLVTVFLQATNQPAPVALRDAGSGGSAENPSPADSTDAGEPRAADGRVWLAVLRYLAELRSP